MVTQQEFEQVQKNDKTISFAFTQNGSVYDITGATITIMLKCSYNDVDGSAIVDVDGTITDGPNGMAEITITKTDVAIGTIKPGQYHYDIKLFESSGDETTILRGSYTIIAAVTQGA